MTAPRSKIKWGRRGWERIEQPAPPADLIVNAIHHLNARLTAVEQALASLTAPAVKPARSRKSSPTKE
jgi:hypothetical protein